MGAFLTYFQYFVASGNFLNAHYNFINTRIQEALTFFNTLKMDNQSENEKK